MLLKNKTAQFVSDTLGVDATYLAMDLLAYEIVRTHVEYWWITINRIAFEYKHKMYLKTLLPMTIGRMIITNNININHSHMLPERRTSKRWWNGVDES